jgi:hypothetical protein
MNLKIEPTNQQNGDNVDKSNEQHVNDVVKRINEELASGIMDNAINVDITEQDAAAARKRANGVKMKKIAILVSIAVASLAVLVCSVYKTFFTHQLTGKQIAVMANYYNNITNFPMDGVQGYLEQNLGSLTKKALVANNDNVQGINVSQPVVTHINTKNDSIANVYFTMHISTNAGDQVVNAIMAMQWDGKHYSPASDVMITPNENVANSINEVNNQFLAFDNIDKVPADVNSSSKTFVDNFFNMLYSGQSVTPYYKGAMHLQVNNQKYAGMSDYQMYSSKNMNGYNVMCKITLQMGNGVEYTTVKYLSVEQSGQAWIITAVL